MVHTYRIGKSRLRPVAAAVGESLVLLGLLASAIVLTLADTSRVAVAGTGALVLGILLLARALYLTLFGVVREIRLSDDGACEFRGLLGVRRLSAQRIVHVQRASDLSPSEAFAVVRYRGGTLIKISQPFEGLGDFLTRLKALNPAIVVEGFRPARPAVALFPPGGNPRRAWETELFLGGLEEDEDETRVGEEDGTGAHRHAGPGSKAGIALDVVLVLTWPAILVFWSARVWVLAGIALAVYLYWRRWESNG